MKITMKTNKDNILKMFRDCSETETINLETEKGHIYKVGGILNKQEGYEHFIAIKGWWVRV